MLNDQSVSLRKSINEGRSKNAQRHNRSVHFDNSTSPARQNKHATTSLFPTLEAAQIELGSMNFRQYRDSSRASIASLQSLTNLHGGLPDVLKIESYEHHK